MKEVLILRVEKDLAQDEVDCIDTLPEASIDKILRSIKLHS